MLPKSDRSSLAQSSVRVDTPSAWRALKDGLRYRWQLQFQPRRNHIYSKFHRFPTQLSVLFETVLPRILQERQPTASAPLEVVVFACCAGEEAYSLAHAFSQQLPELAVRFRAYDLVPELVDQARNGVYDRDQVESSPFMTPTLLDQMFDPMGDRLRIKPGLAAQLHFATGDITDPSFMSRQPRADLVFAQNVLFHLPRPMARKAFHLLADVLQAPGALFINGMDSDLREALTRERGLTPVVDRLELIHEEARQDRGAHWSGNYWGREPLNRSGRWQARFATIFLRD